MAVMGARPARTLPLGIPRPARRAPQRTARPPVHRAAIRRHAEASGVTELLLVILGAACLALFYLSQSTHVAATGYEIAALEAQLDLVQAQQQQLILDISEARSPAVVEQAARRLGLRPIDESRISFASPPASPAPTSAD